MLRILFVDDEPNVLNGLRLVLRDMRKKWDMSFAGSGLEALRILEEKPHDVVVTDMRMPGMDGGELLAEVQRRFPETLRIILSGYSNYELIIKTVKPAHQFLSKPCNHEDLKRTIERTMRLRSVLTNNRVRSILSEMEALPSLPETYQELQSELGKETPSLQRIGNIIEHDMGMTASLLKLVNSSFFGLRRHISSPHQAVVLLGTETVKGLVLMVELFKQFQSPQQLNFNTGMLWTHCTNVGHLARAIAQHQGMSREMADDCFIAGLLHDVGKLVLVTRMQDEYAKVLELVSEKDIIIRDAEDEIFGATHAEIGAYLLALWGLPDNVVEAAFAHHSPTVCSEPPCFTPLLAVHVANTFEHEMVVTHPEYSPRSLDMDFLHAAGMARHLQEWRECCSTLLATEEEKATS